MEIIKYTYSRFCGIIFMSLTCVRLREHWVWFYDGTIICFDQSWQIVMALFGCIYAIPFPMVLLVGMKLLRQNKITSVTFLLSCLCPLIGLIVMFTTVCIRRSGSKNNSGSVSPASREILSVLQGPYRLSDKDEPLYWEAIISFRRLLLSGITFINYGSFRLLITVILCVIFHFHHIMFYPSLSRHQIMLKHCHSIFSL